jgi:hypothetical protein
MPWTFDLNPGEPYIMHNPTPQSLQRFGRRGDRPGNCLVSIAVLQHTLRNHFENEIYLLGLKRYIHIHLLFENKDGKVNFLEQVFPGKKQTLVPIIPIIST